MGKSLFSNVFLYTASLLSVLMLACNCGTTVLQGAKDASFPTTTASDGAANSRDLMEYITVRTVKIYQDCTVRDDAVIVGMTKKKANRFYDGYGTGVIIRSTKDKSYVVTAYHVVKNEWPKALACKVYVIPQKSVHDGDKLPTKLIARSKKKDVAYLSVDKDLGLTTKLETAPYLGMPVYAVGYTSLPTIGSQKKMSISEGVLATVGLSSKKGKIHRVTSQIYFGNSGGGIWSVDGKLVGIAVMLVGLPASGWIPYEGSYYIKPASELYEVASDNKRIKKQILGEK